MRRWSGRWASPMRIGGTRETDSSRTAGASWRRGFITAGSSRRCCRKPTRSLPPPASPSSSTARRGARAKARSSPRRAQRTDGGTMCFGMTTTGQNQGWSNQNQSGSTNLDTASTTSLPDWLNQAAQANYNFAQNIPGYTPYGGQLSAGLTPDQLAASTRIANLAGSTNPYTGAIQSYISGYGNAPASTVNAPSVLGGGYNAMAGSIQDYLNPYIQASLTPQLQNIERA